MGRGTPAVHGLLRLALGCLIGILPYTVVAAPNDPPTAVQATPPGSASSPLELTADRLEYREDRETYEADGSVVMTQDSTRLTAHHVTIRMLTGRLTARGAVHLVRGTKEVWADQMDLNLNTEAGVIANGRLLSKSKDIQTLVTARRFQRFSEDRYRAQDGSFTNCDAMEGKIPAWRFTFEEVDVTLGDSLYLKNTWFCVHDVPLVPIPKFNYPVGVPRKTGLLFPTPGYNSEFGFHYRQGFFWAINPSHDLTITPEYFSKRGYGGDLSYRYLFSRHNRGQWLLNGLQDTELDRLRGFLRGSHAMQVTPSLDVRAKAFMVKDRTYLEDVSESGASRALPAAESTLNIRQQFGHGSLSLLAQYLQPLQAGGARTFQRLPELRTDVRNLNPFNGPFLLGVDSTLVYWWRKEEFTLARSDVMPRVTMKPFFPGKVVGVIPAVHPRVVTYTRGRRTTGLEQRETFWASVKTYSRLMRRYGDVRAGSLRHTIEPDVIYEYVPTTKQGDIVVIDDVDTLPKKHLVTYTLRNRLVQSGLQGSGADLLVLTLSQSYQVGRPTGPTAPTRRFSDVWGRAVIGNTLTVESSFDPYRERFRQVNTDLWYKYRNSVYGQVGHRYTRTGIRFQRGDIWNPLSFGRVFPPAPKISFLTASGAVRTPLGWTVGGKVLHDLATGETTEYDLVGLYQNPCRCWSFGLYFIKFPDRSQINFLIHLAGLGGTNSVGTQLLQALLNPLVAGERGLPW